MRNGVLLFGLWLELAVPALLWNIVNAADFEPDVFGILARRNGLGTCSVAKRAQNQVVQEHLGVGNAELIAHEFIEFAEAHLPAPVA